MDTLIAIADGCRIEIKWLAVGKGPMRIDSSPEPSDPPPPEVDAELLRSLAKIVSECHAEAGQRLPGDALVREAADSYNELLTRAEDPADREELESLLPWFEARLRKRLKAAREEPGTGKRSA
mgnify:CR=1